MYHRPELFRIVFYGLGNSLRKDGLPILKMLSGLTFIYVIESNQLIF